VHQRSFAVSRRCLVAPPEREISHVTGPKLFLFPPSFNLDIADNASTGPHIGIISLVPVHTGVVLVCSARLIALHLQ
jgi:hypothetical protein